MARPKLLSLMAFFSLPYFYFYTLSSFEPELLHFYLSKKLELILQLLQKSF